ncbi:MAG: DNA recombination protein RmuC [Rhodobacteraceae bacterium]|jgi:DNA recombination protein RmuC|uniref:DNA recombination protein RmuC n=1 Tax=Roseobacteraceae TaxID=2854170 RepID=UPI001935A7C5|nr:DNA recombination protein RmuC [Roseovarius sp. 10]MBE1290050.1 DNA recombination protein RmuC [Paracoccaceae bacterium]MBF9021989.1 DNA recombination protein RmuC [Rhodobacterales bacterium FZCC0069]MBF9027334.1 DNA recombination protein RmuC [Rhodobacterales bacterium FZCC0188]QPI86750.1 DNA recombination protein RmuC [Rhodobacterales bacterium HKCCA1288]MDV7201783.1 DNA recombination protein RmuC [Roseovarius sp. 10]
MQLDLSNPIILGALIGGVILIALFWVTLAGVKAANRSAAMMEPLARNLGGLEARVQSLSDGQQQLSGGLAQVVDLQSKTQAQMLQAMERRLEEVQKGMSETLHGTSTRTARSLGELQQKLEQIDRAQAKIEKLSGDVLGLQDILSNKQTRGAFGEIQLNDIVSKALPSDSYAFQATLSNGKRADCLIHLPKPPGPIVIDSKFPLEAYEALRAAKTAQETQDAARAFRTSVRGHIKAISERYILEGETADGALMFLPSEAVYAELHANFPEIVREGFAARVWIVSPTTCMATLNTMRAVLKDARMREQAGAIRKQLGLLHRDVELVFERVNKLNTHFGQARKDIDDISIAAERAGKRAIKLDNFDFEEIAPDPMPPLPDK